MLRGVVFGPIRLERWCDVTLRNIECEGYGWQESDNANNRDVKMCGQANMA